MSKGILGTNTVAQIGIIVRDIESSATFFAEFFGVDKPAIIVSGTADEACTEYNGASTPARAKLAFFNAGQVAIELIEPDGQPSTWREFLDTNGEGVHHIAFVVDGMKQKVLDLGKLGINLVQKGEYTGGRYAYMDSLKGLKVMLELLENDKK